MEKYTSKDYVKIYKNLPEEAKKIFWSDEVTEIIIKLRKRYDIEEDNTYLPKIIGLVVLGIIPLSKLPETLSSRTGIDHKSAERLSDDIKRFILFSIKDFLEESYGEKFTIWEFRSKDKEIENIKNKERAESVDDPYKEEI